MSRRFTGDVCGEAHVARIKNGQRLCVWMADAGYMASKNGREPARLEGETEFETPVNEVSG
jgi:hypothetical protein